MLTLYYFEELTMKEIGVTLGVVESRISQIHSSAVVRLRTALAGLRSDQTKKKAGVTQTATGGPAVVPIPRYVATVGRRRFV